MKLVFYSEILAENSRMDKDVYKLIDKDKPKIGYISSESEETRKYFRKTRDYFERYGFSDFLYFDLDKEYHPAIKKELATCDFIYLSGGNTFHFLYHIKRRKFTSFLKKCALNGKVMIGISAGAIIMTPTINIETVFEGSEDENKLGLKDFSALNLVNFEFFPHFGKKSEKRNLEEYSKKTHNVIYACRDGAGIIVDGNKAKFYGEVKPFLKGRVVNFEKPPCF